VEFLTENSIEPFTSQLWLTPEIGEALGLPPDEIVVAAIEPRPRIRHLESPSSTISLRPGGLGPVDFGTPMDAALAALVGVLGAPDSDSVSNEPECTLAIEQTRTVSWDSAGLHVTFTDWPGRFDSPPAPLHLASWSLWSISAPEVALTTADGIGIGSTAGEVRSLPNSSPMIPDVTQWGFQVAEPTGSVSGEIGWSVHLPSYFFDEQFARELQQALNRQGATWPSTASWGHGPSRHSPTSPNSKASTGSASNLQGTASSSRPRCSKPSGFSNSHPTTQPSHRCGRAIHPPATGGDRAAFR
jgi:hypothetical protein